MSRVLVESGPDQGALWHSGAFSQEQRDLYAGQAWADLGHRPVILITGQDRLTWIHNLTTQHVLDLPPKLWVENLILSPHGHVEHAFMMMDDGQTTWIHCEPHTGNDLVQYLNSMKFMLRVEVRDGSKEFQTIRIPGLPDGSGGPFQIVPRGSFQSDAREVGMWAIEAERISAGRARLKFETDHKTIPNEVGWLHRAVHMNKGCYRGQEAVARTFNLGKPPRRLVQLHLDGSDSHIPSHCTPVYHNEVQVGFLGSAVLHYELGPIGLALIKRNVPVDVVLKVGEISAAQDLLIVAP